MKSANFCLSNEIWPFLMGFSEKSSYSLPMNALARWRWPIALVCLTATLDFCLMAQEPTHPDWKELRMNMVDKQIQRRGVKDPAVLDAMRVVKRHELVPALFRDKAYEDHPLPIGEDQTISQPYIVGLMSELLQAEPGDKILEIGTGSGYQAAVLAEMGLEVFSIEIIESLANRAATDLVRIGYPDVTVKWGDGYQGWAEEAPFDGIIITAAPPQLPEPLVEQLKVGGRIVVPVGRGVQDLNVYTKKEDGKVSRKTIIPVRFVPMTGRAQEDP